MTFNNISIVFAVSCIFGALACVIAEWRSWQLTRIVSKIAASTAFVALAAVTGATNSDYGRMIIIALVLCWVGDVMLLSLRSSLLLGGIGAFLLAHIAFAVAFVLLPLDELGLSIGLLSMMAVAGILIRWLWPHLELLYKFAVPTYIAAIVMMTSLAIAASSGVGSWLPAIGAVAFAASDISVARDRFVERSVINKAWGLPLYYAAQIMLACTVHSR